MWLIDLSLLRLFPGQLQRGGVESRAMSVVQLAGVSFAVEANGLSDNSPFVWVATRVQSTDRPTPLLVIADVVDAVPDAATVAQEIVRGVSVYLQHVDQAHPDEALKRCFATANIRVLEENRNRTGMRRLHLGLTCVMIDGQGLYVAQCAPSQLLVWQDANLVELPSLSTWSARDITGTFTSLSYPLGFQQDIVPRISYTEWEPGDVVAAVSWQLARHLDDTGLLDHRTGVDVLYQALSDDELASASRYVHGAVFRLGTVAGIGNKVPDVRDPQQLIKPDPGIAPDFGSRIAPVSDTLDPGHFLDSYTDELPTIRTETLSVDKDAEVVELTVSSPTFSGRQHSSKRRATQDRGGNSRKRETGHQRGGSGRPPARRGHIVEILAGLLLSLSAAVVGVWQISKRDRPIHGPKDDGTLGLPHLQRWSHSYHAPRFQNVRRVSPRMQVNRFLAAGAAVVILAIAGLMAFNAINNQESTGSQDFQARLVEISTIRASIDTSIPSDVNYQALQGAHAALVEMEGSAPSDEMLAGVHEEQAAVATAITELTGSTTLSAVQVLGALPPVEEGVTPRLFTGAGRVFVLSDSLYELDTINGNLILLLAAGQEVGGSPVGTMLAATWNEDRLMVVDSMNVFVRNPGTGEWQRVPLGVITEGGFADFSAVTAFDRNLYFLSDGLGKIYKYDALDFGAPPEDWASATTGDALSDGVDFHIDGFIHVLGSDGRIMSFFRSAIERTIEPVVRPEGIQATAFQPVLGGKYFYIVDGGNGRIVAINNEGQLFQQFTTGPDQPSLRGATDLVINESNGLSYMLVNNTLFTVRLTVPGE